MYLPVAPAVHLTAFAAVNAGTVVVISRLLVISRLGPIAIAWPRTVAVLLDANRAIEKPATTAAIAGFRRR
jgi:hypothetical protein